MSAGKRGPLARPRHRDFVDRWEVKVNGKYVPILDEFGNYIRGNTAESRDKADACWHLMLQREQAPAKGGNNLVAVVLDIYLDEVQRLRPRRYAAASRTFQTFIDLFPELTVNDLTERHIDDWFEAHPEWRSPNTRMTRLASLTTAFNWASRLREGERLVPLDHPLRNLDLDRLRHKPYHRRRSGRTCVSEQVHVFLMNNVPADFRRVLFALRHTGTRPGNICKVTAENFFEKHGVWVFEEQNVQEGEPVHKAYDATREALVVPLTGELVELCKRLREENPAGPLFRKADGQPWTPDAIANRFLHYRDRFRRMGVPIPEVTFAYAYRHSVGTELVVGGETDAMAAAVLGHGVRTFHQYYNHVLARSSEQVNALRRHVLSLPGELAALSGGAADPEPPAGEQDGRDDARASAAEQLSREAPVEASAGSNP
jgi:hypothetical protein